MALSDYSNEGIDCTCAFIATLDSGLKNDIGNLIGALKALADVLKIVATMASVNWEDELRILGYQGELAALEKIVEPLSAPLSLLESYTKPFADCDPISGLSTAITRAKTKALSGLVERQYEIEQYIAALEDNKNELRVFDRMIAIFEDIEDAIDQCGSV